MQHWWKWLVVTVVVGSMLFVIGSVLTSGNSIGRVEAAMGSYWPAWTNPATKIVPIISAGTPGLRLGLAQVSGRKLEVDKVKAVLQLDGDFKSVRLKIFVPTDSYTDLRRVPGTAVTGLVQYKLLDFSSHRKGNDPKPAAQSYDAHYYPQSSKPSNHPEWHGRKNGWHKHPEKHHGCQ